MLLHHRGPYVAEEHKTFSQYLISAGRCPSAAGGTLRPNSSLTPCPDPLPRSHPLKLPFTPHLAPLSYIAHIPPLRPQLYPVVSYPCSLTHQILFLLCTAATPDCTAATTSVRSVLSSSARAASRSSSSCGRVG